MIRKIGKFEIDLYKHGIELYIGDMPEETHPSARAYTELLIEERLVKIYLQSKKEFDFYIMHECIHAADFILHNIGANIDCSPNNSEIRAYLAEYIYCCIGTILGTIKLDKKIRLHK